MSIQCRVVIAEPPRARSVRGEASIVLENGNLPMRENFVMMSGVLTHARPSIRFGRKVLSRLCRGGNGNHAACVCLGETLTSSPRGSQWSFSSKDIEFLLFELREKKL